MKKLGKNKPATLAIAILTACAVGIFGYLSHSYMKLYSIKPVPHTWVNIDQKKDFDQPEMLRKKTIQCITMIIIVLALFIIFLTAFHNFERLWLWIAAISLSCLLCIGIILIWHLEIKKTEFKIDYNVVANDEDVKNFFTAHKKENPKIYEPEAHFLPVGFLFYSIEINEERITIGSYPWLKRNMKKDSDIPNIFIAMNATQETKTWTVDNRRVGDIEDASWQEQLQIESHFNYAKYPFDQQDIVIRFEEEETLKKTILLPDFGAYLPGNPYPPLDPSFHLDGWTIKNAYFFYDLSDYSTNFGIKDYWQVKNYPFLGYVIRVQRNFFEPLFSGLIPIIIILFITFACLLLLPNQKGADIRLILALLSSLFFANVLSYQNLQTMILTPDITYLKSFYIIAYVVIFLVAVNIILYVYRANEVIIYKSNLLARLLYWPVVLSIFFIATLIFFY